MRRTNFTSHIKLSAIIILLCYFVAAIAQQKDEDTNIVCFAAQNKWICAPEDKQHIANEKAAKLIEEKKSEQVLSSDVVIKTINIPKFDSAPTVDQKIQENVSGNNQDIDEVSQKAHSSVAGQVVTDEKVTEANQVVKPDVKTVSEHNPYALLWSHQLIGLSTPQSAVNFVKQKNLDPDETLIIKSTRAGMDWWIVLYGLYKDKQTGLDNEGNLPNSLDKPWLRPLKNLKVFGFIEKY